MKSPVITVTPDTLVHDAQKIMNEHKIRRLPVVEKGKMVGLITRNKLREAAPSPATSLSMWEISYLLAKMKVKDVMIRKVHTLTPDTTLEEASILAQKYNIGTLPVLDNQGNLVGIVTTTDLYHAITQILGFGEKGARLYIKNCNQGVVQPQVMEILARHGAGVLSIFSLTPAGSQQKNFFIRLDMEDISPIMEDIKNLGCEIEVRER